MSGPTLPVTTPTLEMSMGLQQSMPTGRLGEYFYVDLWLPWLCVM